MEFITTIQEKANKMSKHMNKLLPTEKWVTYRLVQFAQKQLPSNSPNQPSLIQRLELNILCTFPILSVPLVVLYCLL